MIRGLCLWAWVGSLIASLAVVDGPLAQEQKAGGILRIYTPDSPASMSPHEESTAFAIGPMMGVFNNLVLFDQNVKQNTLQSIVPDLATSWDWSEDKTKLTFRLRQGVRWHDGKTFTSNDVECTWTLLLERAPAKLRANPRFSAYRNLDRVSTDGDWQVTFHLKRPQPAFLMLLAGGWSPVYPCHVAPEIMRKHPIGTGPFKFVTFAPNQHIKIARNPDYWKPNKPYLDGIEYTIIRSVGTALLSFTSGNLDMTFPAQMTVHLMKDVQRQSATTVCELSPGTINGHVIMNRSVRPFDNPKVRRAITLAIDRKAFIDIIGGGEGDIGAVLQPPPGGLWGMPPDLLKELPGYDRNVQKNRRQAREIMMGLGYGESNRLKVKLLTRDLPLYRDPAIILIDQLKEIYFDAELELVDTGAYFPRLRRKDFAIGFNMQTSGPDPDPTLDQFYGCGSSFNWDNYCNPDIDKLIEQQSMETDQARRRQLVWAIERNLADDGARPIIFYAHRATCWHPYVKGITIMVNSFFNGYRGEDVWLDR
jgi:peptide/nickel transport system substrate-binding protein